MKKLCALTALITLLAANAYAGHSESIRRYCFLWLIKRYYAQAHLSRAGFFGPPVMLYGSKANCTGATVHLVGPYGLRCEVHSIAHSQADMWGAWGYLWLQCGYKGGMSSALYEDMMMGAADGSGEITEANTQETKFNPEFSDKSVTIRDLSISLQSDVSATYDNTYTLTLWTPLDDSATGTEDSVITPAKTLYTGTVTLRRGTLTVEGDLFSAGDFALNREGSLVTVTYTGGDKYLDVSKRVAPGTQMMLSGSGDIKNEEAGLLKKVLADQDGVVAGDSKMNIYPNPAGNSIAVIIEAAAKNLARIRVYDIQGKVVLDQGDVQLNEGSNRILVNTAALPAGQYYVGAAGTGMKVISGFIRK
jgi:hypothetical protein